MSGFVLENEKEIGALNDAGFINLMSLESCCCMETKWIFLINSFILYMLVTLCMSCYG